MMNNDNNWLPFVIIVIIIVLIGILVSRMFLKFEVTEEEKPTQQFITDPNNEYIQWLTKTRNTLLEMLLNTLVNAWQLTDEDAKQASSTQTDINSAIMVLAYQNYLFRFYVNWQRKNVTIGFTTNNGERHIVKRKNFGLNNGTANFEAIYDYFMELASKYRVNPTDHIIKCTPEELNALIGAVKTGIINGQAFDVDQYWKDWCQEILDNGVTVDELTSFMGLTRALAERDELKQEEVIEK